MYREKLKYNFQKLRKNNNFHRVFMYNYECLFKIVKLIY